jgi:phage terminase large subunit-like protein
MQLSVRSFQRLSDEQQCAVFDSWHKFLSESGDHAEQVNATGEMMRLRFLAQTNLYFMCKLLVIYGQVTLGAHEYICNSFFVQKDPTLPTFRAFADGYGDLKSRLLLVPRGGFKSSIDIADCVQWIVCYPEITIAIMTGVFKLATDFISELRAHFMMEDSGSIDETTKKPIYRPCKVLDRVTGDKETSIFQVLFPEHCIPPGEGIQTEFQTAAAGEIREPSVRSASIEQALSGAHYCLSPDTWVYTEDGVKQVKNFQIGDKVLTHKGRYRRVVALKERLSDRVTITFKKIGAFPVTCSVDHPFLTDQGWEDAENLVIGTKIMRPVVNESPSSPIPQLESVYNMFGWFIAEGSIRNNQVQFSGNIDETEVFENLGKLFVAYGADSYRIKQVCDRGIVLYIRKAPKVFTDVFRSMYVGPCRKNIPAWLINSPRELLMALVRGMWSGDGDDRGSLTTISDEIAAGALMIKQKLGLQQSCSVAVKENHTLRVWGNVGLYEGKPTNPRNGSDTSIVESVDRVGVGSVISVQIEEDETICIVGAVTHNCVMKLDDVVTNENSLTLDRLAKVNRQIGINKALMHPYGFLDVIGTWYDEHDYYGQMISKEISSAERHGLQGNIRGSIDSGQFDSAVLAKVHLRAALWLTDEAKRLGKIEEETVASDWVIWFPELLSYDTLMGLKEQDPDVFPIKYLNDPRQVHKIKFPRELLMRRTIPQIQLPQQGVIVSVVDAAYSLKSWADYTVIITALIYGGRFYILNMVRGRFNEYELPSVIAAIGLKWKPKRICIENSVGVKWISPELRREMQKLQISIPVEFVSLGLGTKAKSKQLKAKPVLRLLGDERLYFSKSCEGLEEIYNEMEQFTGTSDDVHDDIVDALSLLVSQFSAYADMGSRLEVTNVDYAAHQREAELSDLVYCTGKYSYLSSNMAADDNPRTAFQVEQAQAVQEPESIDPFADLMG